ncbi:MAG: transglycosylase SLT domain-containing protein [Myxococcaceae bacterium]|nr:transglycosylase SLT domain-containing protein [Myxococcaceae bacterium]
MNSRRERAQKAPGSRSTISRGILASLFITTLVAQGQTPQTAPVPSDPESADPGFAELPNPAFPSPHVYAIPVERGLKIERADWAPYFATGKLRDAKAAFDAGDFRKARALLEGQGDAPAVMFLKASAAERLNDDAAASKEFEAVAGRYPAMRDRCLVSAGMAYEGVKDFASALRVFSAVGPTSKQFNDATMGMARAYRGLRDFTNAAKAVAALADRPAPPWGRDIGAEGLWTLADVWQAKRDAKAERAVLLRLWAGHPLYQSARVEARLGALNDVTPDVKVARAESLIEAHRNAQGVALVEPLTAVLKLPDALACKASFVLGKGYRKLRQHAKAMSVLEPVTKKCTDPDLRARALYTLAFSRSVVLPATAAETYEELARAHPTHSFADDGLFFAADARFKEGNVEKALEQLAELTTRYPSGDFVGEALFKQFWIHRASQNSAAALAVLDDIERRFAVADESYEVDRARYWRSRLLEDAGNTAQAAQVLRQVALEHPTTYYGLIARERLLKLDEAQGKLVQEALSKPVPERDPFPFFTGPVGKDPRYLTAVELHRLGFDPVVQVEVLSIDRTALPVESLRTLVYLLDASGEERAAHGMARLWLKRDLSGPVTPENKALWKIAYPPAFRDIVAKHSLGADKLDPDLLQAVMREESALDPKALSWAGALGLTQLMPRTAWDIAARLKLKRPSTADLLEPELNIQLGARYLADLMKRAKEVRQYALAGYNAGEGAVARWKRQNVTGDVDEWVELIPLTETRGYVKRVLRTYNTYKLLYREGAAAQITKPSAVFFASTRDEVAGAEASSR